MSFNEHCLVVFTTFINFINSFRFDTSFFALYIFLIIHVRFKFLLSGKNTIIFCKKYGNTVDGSQTINELHGY
jgi:hypothetical protein